MSTPGGWRMTLVWISGVLDKVAKNSRDFLKCAVLET